MFWQDVPIHVLDFEGSVRTGIVEYGVATLFGGRIVDTATRLCSVREPIPLEESEVHGIFDDDLEGRPPVDADWDFFKKLRGNGLLGSHHAPAEIGMLTSVWPVPGTVPDFSLETRPLTTDWGPWVDTCRIAKEWFPHEPKHGLGALVARFDIADRIERDAKKFCPRTRSRFHCALYDAIAAAHLLINMCEHPYFANSEILDLVRASSSARRFRERIQGELNLFGDE